MKTFLLGLGAQKAGTTWMHRQLQSNANTSMGFVKEYHILDTLTLPHMTGMLRKRQRDLPDLPPKADHQTLLDHLSSREFLWLSLYSRPGAYYDYFASLLEPDGIDLTGDITPSYSGLAVDTLVRVQDEFARRDIKVKCIFLMRDPVERLWSAVRMRRNELRARKPDRKLAPGEDRAMLKDMDSDDARLRGNYHNTLQALSKAFDPADCFVGFYETFVSDPGEWQRFTDMLGVGLAMPDYGRRQNATAKNTALAEDTIRSVASSYRDSYDYVRRHFPDFDIDSHWPSSRYL